VSAQVAAELRAAADVLERDGWTQNAYTDQNGCHCVMGAAYVAMGCPTTEWAEGLTERVDAVRDFLGTFLGRRPHLWNDAPGRTAEEVIAALRAAADAAGADQ
jgi:hypothetical protein